MLRKYLNQIFFCIGFALVLPLHAAEYSAKAQDKNNDGQQSAATPSNQAANATPQKSNRPIDHQVKLKALEKEKEDLLQELKIYERDCGAPLLNKAATIAKFGQCACRIRRLCRG